MSRQNEKSIEKRKRMKKKKWKFSGFRQTFSSTRGEYKFRNYVKYYLGYGMDIIVKSPEK